MVLNLYCAVSFIDHLYIVPFALQGSPEAVCSLLHANAYQVFFLLYHA